MEKKKDNVDRKQLIFRQFILELGASRVISSPGDQEKGELDSEELYREISWLSGHK